MNFPKKCIMEEGSIFLVTFESIKEDWASTVKQFDDLSEKEQQKLIDDFDDEQAETWWCEQWYGYDIVSLGSFEGVDEEVRNQFLKVSLSKCADRAYEYEGGLIVAEVRNIKYAGWYASYVEDNQGKCLIGFLNKRVNDLEQLLENIAGECELSEYPAEMLLNSIKELATNIPYTEHQIGYFKWTTKE